MDYYSNAQELSNTSVVDICIIDNLAEKIDYKIPINLSDIINLARLVESFILSNEVVIKQNDFVFLGVDYFDFDYNFSERWIKEFSKIHVIREGYDSASNVLSNEFVIFDKRSSKIKKELDRWIEYFDFNHQDIEDDLEYEFGMDDIDHNISYNLEISNNTWENMTSFYGIPFLTEDFNRSMYNASKITNISMKLYRKIENYYDEYFAEISKYLGPTYFRIPFLLGMVLQECSSIEDIPTATMYIRDKFVRFNMETTELEYQLRTAKTIFEQMNILKTIESAYENIANKYNENKRRIQSRVFDIVQSFDFKEMSTEAIRNIREMQIEKKGLMLIPGYYDLWKATEEVEQALPQLKRLFGKQLVLPFTNPSR